MFLKRKSSHLNPQTRTRPEDSKHARGNMRAPRAPLATLRKSGEGRGPAPHATRGPGPDRRRARARARARAKYPGLFVNIEQCMHYCAC